MVNVVSTFAGCGGSSLGYKRAGCKVLLAIDFEENAVKTYRMNFPETKVWKANVREIIGPQILKEIGLKRGELDILDGSPPCSPFSVCGKGSEGWNVKYKHSSESTPQRADDLFYEYIRLIDELRPKVFVGENVRGLIRGKAKGYFNDILKKMGKIGYDTQVFDINAKDFEVPQSRPRIIFLGIRSDIAKKGLKPTLMKLKPISFNKATKGVVNTKSELDWARLNPQSRTGALLLVTKPGETAAKHHPKGSFFNMQRVEPTKPIPTIITQPWLAHPYDLRWLTISELKRCASFPDDFKFLSHNDAWRRIGNSVPPNLMKHVAFYLMERLNGHR